MVVDSVIRYWVTVVAPAEYGTEGLGLSIQDLEAQFYANNGLVASTQPERLQRAFVILSVLFDQVGIRMNASETVSMTC